MHWLLGNRCQNFFLRQRRRALIVFGCAAILLLLPCTGRQTAFSFPPPPQGQSAGLSISSPSFSNGDEIPKKFTCSGADASPQLSWTEPPAGTKTFALLVDDPDAPAGNWNHWAMWNLPASARSLPEGVGKSQRLPDGSQQGLNDFRKIGYNGPCPPANKPHRYHFQLFALDTKLSLKADAGKPELEAAMKGHILARAEWMGTFHR
jgi:Raf kinase inhibitor-like YbhB/YbcL family protein